MKILVTGGSGLVGRYVVDELATPHEIDVLDLKAPHRSDLRWHSVDVTDFNSLSNVVAGYDAVVHLAGIPHPLNDPAEKVFRVNTIGTFNMLEACTTHGIKKFIFMSSESTLGFAFSSSRMWPEFVPIDENHPLRPEDSYGLSKLMGELLCRAYTHRTGIQTICIRPAWIWVPEEKEIQLYRQLIEQYPQWYKNLWAYVHVDDLTNAVRLSLESKNLAIHDALFISADDNWTSRDSRELLAQFYPETKKVSSEFSGSSSFISNAKAKRVLGFRPMYSWRDIVC